MSRKTLALLLAALVAAVSPSLAKDMTGKYSLGFHHWNAPIGGRYWVNQSVALDLGLGFTSREVVKDYSAEPLETAQSTSFQLEAGVPIKLYDADIAHFYARPAVMMGILDGRSGSPYAFSSDEKWTSLDLILSLGAELFFGEHFSVEASHGVKANFTAVPDDVKDDIDTDWLTSFQTFGNNLTTIGFHFYF